MPRACRGVPVKKTAMGTAMGTVTLLLFTMVGNGLHMCGDLFCLKVLANVEPLPLG